METLKFVGGCHSEDNFAKTFLTPLFEEGVITQYPGADRYAICYGELCAYNGAKLLASWSAGVPDCEEDCDEPLDSPWRYGGEWVVSE
jgi:hypothetical protein